MGKRLTVNLRPKAERALAEITEAGELDITDSINRGLELLAWWRQQEAAGFTHMLRHPDGNATDIMMLS